MSSKARRVRRRRTFSRPKRQERQEPVLNEDPVVGRGLLYSGTPLSQALHAAASVVLIPISARSGVRLMLSRVTRSGEPRTLFRLDRPKAANLGNYVT